jgi:hypothetical protein
LTYLGDLFAARFAFNSASTALQIETLGGPVFPAFLTRQPKFPQYRNSNSARSKSIPLIAST